MAKVELTKEERRFDAMGLSAMMLATVLKLKREYTEEEVTEALELLKVHHPKLMKWMEGKLHEVNDGR